MSPPPVIIVHLRRPRRRKPDEARSDPFYEFGSFGCTKCHSKNVLHPDSASELVGCRIAFAQGGAAGFRLICLTPPVRVVHHRDRCELTWTPTGNPFRYAAAPLLIDNEWNGDFPALREMLRPVNRTTPVGKFSSLFRSSRQSLPEWVAREMISTFDAACLNATTDAFAGSYVETLPYPPNNPDHDRLARLNMLRARIARDPIPEPERGLRHDGC